MTLGELYKTVKELWEKLPARAIDPTVVVPGLNGDDEHRTVHATGLELYDDEAVIQTEDW